MTTATDQAVREIVERMANDRQFRRETTRESFFWFFLAYFDHYTKHFSASFQHEILGLLDKDSNDLLVLVAFRGSGKSTIVTTAYALWAILGKQQKKFAIIASQTQRQSRQHLLNIKRELENNAFLRNDLGPFREERDEWGSLALVISNYDAKLAAVSTEQSIRGVRHGQHRPDLVICDDIEDLGSVRTQEGRNKTYRWYLGEIGPVGDQNTRVIVVGNLLHADSIVMRLKRSIQHGELAGSYREYPFLDESGKCLWSEKFPDQASIDAERKRIGNYNAWMREYMLAIIPEDDQVVFPQWITRYNKIPSEKDPDYRYTIASFDLAISKKQSSDNTASVIAKVFGYGQNVRIYILRYPLNQKIGFVRQQEVIKELFREYNGKIKIIIENNGYQDSLVEQLNHDGYPVEGVSTIGGGDKKVRLSYAAPYVKNKVVLFPENGTEVLEQQLIGFGVEKDDLADAFSMLVNYCANDQKRSPRERMDSFFQLNEHLSKPDPDSVWNKKY